MAKGGSVFLLEKYFALGWLERRYFDGKHYVQPYSADDRLKVGQFLYHDFVVWKKGTRLVSNYDFIKIDVSFYPADKIAIGRTAERFRKALRVIPKSSLAVVYKIVLNEEEITPPKAMSAREKLYFNDEIKGLLCRGLDELCLFYRKSFF